MCLPAQFISVTQTCLVLWDPMDCSMPGLFVHHQLLEFTQTRVHWIGDAIQTSHPLSSPSSPAFNLSQHQSLFQWVSSSHQVAKILEFQLQHQSFQWTPRTDLLQDGLVGSLTVQGTLKSLTAPKQCTHLVVQSPSHVLSFVTPWTAALQASLFLTISLSLPKFMSIELVMPSNHLVLCHPLLLPSVFPSIRVFSNELAVCIRWSANWSFSFNISLPSEYHSWFPNWLVLSLCCPRDSQESSLAPQFKSINSSVLCLLYCPALTSIHDHWRRK